MTQSLLVKKNKLEQEILEKSDISSKALLRAKNDFKDFPEKKFLELAELYYIYAFKDATRFKRDVKSTTLKYEAVVICLLGFFSAQDQNIDFEDVKNVDELFKVIRKSSGLEAVDKWLKLQSKDSENILKSSGVFNFYSSLYKLSFTLESTKLLESLEELKKTTSDIFDWFKAVKILNAKQVSGGRMGRFISNINSSVLTWNKHKIYLTLIMGITLESEKSSFSLDDLSRFCALISEQTWLSGLKEKLDLLFASDGEDLKMSKNISILEIANSLTNPKNQNIVYFLGKINIKQDDFKTLSDFAKVVNDALPYTKRQLDAIDGLQGNHISENAKKKIGFYLSNMKAESVYEFLKKNPYLISWISRGELFRMAVIDDVKGGELLNAYMIHYKNKQIIEIFNLPKEEKSISSVLYEIMREEFPFDLKFAFFEKNRLQRKSNFKSERNISYVFDKVIYLINRESSLHGFHLWLSELDKIGVTIPLSKVKHFKVFSQLLVFPENKISKNVIEYLQKEPWFGYLTPKMINSFKLKLSEVKVSKRKVKKKEV